MTRRRPVYEPTPRILSDYELATMMGNCENVFRKKRPQLEAEGFPKHDELLGGTDADAVHRWLDRRSGLAMVDADQELDEWQP